MQLFGRFFVVMSEDDDVTLVQRSLKGDTSAYEELVRRHERRIFFLGLKFHKNFEDAEDFTQEVFLKAYENLATYSTASPFSAWLYRIGYNHGINRISKKRAQALSEEHQELLESGVDGPEDRLEKEETRGKVREILKKLPEMYNMVIRMRFFDGLSYAQIAEIIGKPINTIKSHIFRAKELIRESVERYFRK